MSMIGRMVRKLRTMVTGRIAPPASYSQAGEDAIVRFLFYDKKMSKISYLDIGANTPDANNNTYLFYRTGSRGVCVEADVTLIKHIKKVRPEDKVLNLGVSVDAQPTVSGGKSADFYIFDIKGINTFDKEEAEKRAAFGTYRIEKVVKVDLININQLIKENFTRYPDFLSIDIEGLDLAVLKSLDYATFPIPCICVETCQYSENHIRPKDHSISEFLTGKGYEVYADTYINTIFINKDWFYKLPSA